MIPLPPCPDVDHCPPLPDDTLSVEERERYERHLESCPACQARLDRAADLDGPLQLLGRRFGDPTTTPTDPNLSQFLDQLQRLKSPLRTAASEEPDLYFLEPVDRPDLLGTLGDYEVRQVIGQGGMGVVLKAFEPALQRLVAIKVMAAPLAGSATARRRFKREAQAAAAVCHDNIVPVYGVHEQDGLPYLVMQYVAGESLQERLDRSGPLELVEIVRIGLQTAQGLAAAHAQGLIHRDIKPANLLLENGLAKVKITDFGLARMSDDVGLTQNGVVAGTPEYMSPEQARGEPIDHRADLFSLGSVLYAMATGRPAFRGATTMAVIRKISDQVPKPVRELNPNIPTWLEDLIARLLAKQPEQRIQSAAETAQLLEGYLAHLRQPATVNAPLLLPVRHLDNRKSFPPGPSGLRWHFSPRVWLSLLVLLAALGLGGSFLFLGAVEPGQQNAGAGKPQPARQRLAFDLRAGWKNFPPLALEGPDAAAVVAMDPGGLRFTLPAGRRDTRPVGLELPQRLRGDFDIVLDYELLAVGDPVPRYGAGVLLKVWFDAPPPFSVLLSRSRKPAGERFGAHRLVPKPDGTDQYLNNAEVRATGSRGKLRLLRNGSQLRYLVAEEGKDFKPIQTLEIGTADVQTMKVDCNTMYTPIALDVRLTELVIEADQFPDGIPAAQPPTSPAEAPPLPARKGLLTAIVLSGCTLLVLAALGIWLYVRRRGRGQGDPSPGQPEVERPPHEKQVQTAAITVSCPQCGKTSRVRSELAGKKVKCPRCSQPLVVPAINVTEPRRSSR